jgi:hypothetical protein
VYLGKLGFPEAQYVLGNVEFARDLTDRSEGRRRFRCAARRGVLQDRFRHVD